MKNPALAGFFVFYAPGRGCGADGGTTIAWFRRMKLEAGQSVVGARMGAGDEGLERFFARFRRRRMQKAAATLRIEHDQANVGHHVLAFGQRNHFHQVAFAKRAELLQRALNRQERFHRVLQRDVALHVVLRQQELRAVDPCSGCAAAPRKILPMTN